MRNIYIEDCRLLDLTALDNSAKCIGNLVQGSLGQLFGLDSRNRSIANCILDANHVVAQLGSLSGRCRYTNMRLC